MVHSRFYDLPDGKATLISVVGKSGCALPEDARQPQKGLVNLIPIPLLNRCLGHFDRANTKEMIGKQVLQQWK
jgi:hypothetical protein